MGEAKDLAVIEERSVTEVKDQVNKIQNLMRDLMRPNEHYGVIPGTNGKPSLLKAGAEKLCFTFRLVPEFAVERDDLSGGHREYRVTCTLRNASTGNLVGQGLGSCSSMESKYRWRNAARRCPLCGKEAIIKGKEEYGGGWLCFKKKDGCGATFADNDPAIASQPVGRLENPDLADTYNTILKMAKKRAHVDATITACAASDIFTQDVEDMAPEARDPDPEKKEASRSTAPKPATSSGPMDFQDYINLINESVPNANRSAWMQKARGGKDPTLLGQLAADIRKTYPNGAATPSSPDSLRVEIMEFINNIAPAPDRPILRKELGQIGDGELEAALAELKARYAA